MNKSTRNRLRRLAVRTYLTDPVITTYILLWGSIGEPFVKKITGDGAYLWSFTKGFSELPSPAQVLDGFVDVF